MRKWFSAAILFPLVFGVASPVQAAPDRVIKIGVLTDLTGKAAYLGQQTRAAAELLASEVNTAEEKRLEIVLADHSLDTAKAVTETQKLINIDKVDLVFSNFSGTSRAASPIVKNANKLFVYTAAAVEPLNNNPQAFKSYLDYVLGCQKIAKQWKREGVKIVAVLKAEAEFGELCLEGAKREFPDAVVASYKPGDDVSSQVLSLKAKKAEGIVNAGYEGDMGNMLKAMRQIQYAARVGANEDIFTEKMIAEYGPELQHAMAFGVPKIPADLVSRIRAIDTKNLTGEIDVAGMMYLHLKQAYNAAASCPPDDVTCEVKHLKESPKDPVFGFIGWGENRQAEFQWTLSAFEKGRFQVLR